MEFNGVLTINLVKKQTFSNKFYTMSQRNRFTPANVPVLQAHGVIEGPDVFTSHNQMTLSIDSNTGILHCTSTNGFSATVRIEDAVNTGTFFGSNTLSSHYVDVTLSDGTVLICDGTLYPFDCHLLLHSRVESWFWLEVRPRFAGNDVLI